MEILTIWRKQNTDTRVVFPFYDHATGLLVTTVAGLDSEFALDGAHGASAPSFSDCEHEATQIGATGIFYLDIAAAEVNDANGSTINIKTTTEHVDPVCIRIQTLPCDAVLTTASTTAVAVAVRDIATSGLAALKTLIDAIKALLPTTVVASKADVEAVQGTGAIAWTYRVLLDSNGDGTADSPAVGLADVDVWVTSDITGTTRLATGVTDSSGNVVFHLAAGTVYVWRQHASYEFTNPDTEVVS
jgi:hypothetical protein